MKIVVNTCFGGFSIPEEYVKEHHYSSIYDKIDRTDPEFIRWLEEHGESGDYAPRYLEVVEIPDESTDYYIEEYDGMETIFYVVDGKIRLA